MGKNSAERSVVVSAMRWIVGTRAGQGLAAVTLATGAAVALRPVVAKLLASRKPPPASAASDATSPLGALMKSKSKDGKNKKKSDIDAEFFNNLRSLIKVILPSWKSKEATILGIHTCALVARTFLSIYVSYLDSVIVKNIVERNMRAFVVQMLKWIIVAIPATFVNSLIRYMESKLALSFRTRLVDHAYNLYMKDQTYYRVSNLDNRLVNPDQSLTEDVLQFSNNVAHLYSSLSKPLLDMVLMVGTIFRNNWKEGTSVVTAGSPLLLAGAVIGATGAILKVVSPPFGRLVSEQANRDGQLRYIHNRIITNSEEIAFYGGEEIEEGLLRKAYNALVKQTNVIYSKRLFYIMLEQFLMKYVWSGTGMVMVALPTLMGSAGSGSSSVGDRTQHYTVQRGLLVSTADAVERIMSSYKELIELTGYTARVANMFKVFHEVKDGKFSRGTVGDSSSRAAIGDRSCDVSEGSDIEIADMPVITPTGDVLVTSLSLKISHGTHILITGPNGCGKSSLFRILGGLWPVHGGRLVRPHQDRVFYIPQRPYLSLGTFREQIIYPDTVDKARKKRVTDDQLRAILKHAFLEHVLEREGGWDAVNDWQDVLSGGEKQRVGMARLFYHSPDYALLDECTSAVSMDVEGDMYQHAKDLGITLLTITHRPSLWKHHTHLLQFDGCGGWVFQPLDADARLTLKEEKDKLEKAMAGIPEVKARLDELCQLLGEDSIHLTPDDSHIREQAPLAIDESDS